QKTEEAEKDRKEAAVAYRNLGAIARLADPKRALEAYEKALALDPDDIESLFWAGWIWRDYGDLNKAQTRLERAQELSGARLTKSSAVLASRSRRTTGSSRLSRQSMTPRPHAPGYCPVMSLLPSMVRVFRAGAPNGWAAKCAERQAPV